MRWLSRLGSGEQPTTAHVAHSSSTIRIASCIRVSVASPAQASTFVHVAVRIDSTIRVTYCRVSFSSSCSCAAWVVRGPVADEVLL
jgi:hypothetical protein